MDLSLVIPSFIAGVLTFLAPCTLPLVPGYLAFISGVEPEKLQEKQTATRLKAQIFLNGLLYVIGFSVVFVVLGTLAGFVGGTVLGPVRAVITRVGGIFVILFGLVMLDVIRIPFLNAETHITPPKFFKRGSPLNSFLLGNAFAFGWTPCVGPILGSVLILASTSTTALQGAVLLSVFSLGLGVPFLIMALAIGTAYRRMASVTRYVRVISRVGGVFLIILGILLVANKMTLLVSFGFQYLDFINYEQILDYL